MKILISSKLLYSKLSTIDFDKDYVVSALVTEDDVFVLTTKHHALVFSMAAVVLKDVFPNNVRQENRNWESIKETVRKAPEQPVVLCIYEQRVDVIFQY